MPSACIARAATSSCSVILIRRIIFPSFSVSVKTTGIDHKAVLSDSKNTYSDYTVSKYKTPTFIPEEERSYSLLELDQTTLK